LPPAIPQHYPLKTPAKAVTFSASTNFEGFPMSLVIKLEDDLGERSEWVILNGVVPPSTDPNYVLLSGVDPFGKTVFNHLQMEAFLKEWERVRERVRDDSQLEAWQRVKQMAETCRQDRDLYLRFVGN
jgi:hypothetical protein